MGENVVVDNLDIFKMNGFQFEIDHEGTVNKARTLILGIFSYFVAMNSLAMPTKRVKLVGQPVSKNWSLGPKGSLNTEFQKIMSYLVFLVCLFFFFRC